MPDRARFPSTYHVACHQADMLTVVELRLNSCSCKHKHNVTEDFTKAPTRYRPRGS